MATFDPAVLKSPRWILAIAVGSVLVFAFIQLGMWQLSRHEERQTANTLISARMSEPIRALDGLVGQYGADPASLVYRNTMIKGRYLVEDEFFSVGRTYGDVSGTMVITPLELEDGSILIVTRGLVPLDVAGPPAEGYEPPLETVTLQGLIDDGEEPSGIGEPDPQDGVVRSISRVDLEYIDMWMGGDVLPI